MEIKGFIKKGDSRSLTCCDSVSDLIIGEVSLYDALEDFFNQNEIEYWDDSQKKSPVYSLKYVLLEEEPTSNVSFGELSAKVIFDMLYVEHISGCYSEWTCGYGGFDYVIQNGGHSIFKELSDKIGKYIHLVL